MKVHVLFRTHAGANSKKRPAWYSRELSLASLCSALHHAGVDHRTTIVSDGPLPDELRHLASSVSDVVHVRGGSTAASMRRAIEVAVTYARSADDDTFYWLAEDDYVYRPNAMRSLLAAAEGACENAYFALYTADGSALYDRSVSHRALIIADAELHPFDAGGVSWQRIRGTTSTFGMSRQTLLQDRRLLLAGTFAEAPFDGATWHMLQGHYPYAWSHLTSELHASLTPRGVVKACAKPPLRVALNLCALSRRRRRPRALFAPARDLAMHMETDVVPPGTDWEKVASQYESR